MTSAGTDIFASSARKSVLTCALLQAIAIGTEHCINSPAPHCIIDADVSGTKNAGVLSATHFGKSLRQEARSAANADCGTPLGLSMVCIGYGVVGASSTIRATRPLP